MKLVRRVVVWGNKLTVKTSPPECFETTENSLKSYWHKLERRDSAEMMCIALERSLIVLVCVSTIIFVYYFNISTQIAQRRKGTPPRVVYRLTYVLLIIERLHYYGDS